MFAQAQTAWSLKECIEYGLKHFGTVRIAQYQKENARQQSRQALSGYLPQISGSGSFDDNLKLQTTVLPAGVFGPEPTRIALGSKFQTNFSASADQAIFDQSLLIGIKAKSLISSVQNLMKDRPRKKLFTRFPKTIIRFLSLNNKSCY